MNKDLDFKFKNVGYNGPHLAAMPFDKFKIEVKHLHTGPTGEHDMAQLYDLLTKRWPPTPAAPAAPAAPGEVKK